MLLKTHNAQEIHVDIGDKVVIKLEHVFIDLFLLKREVDIYRFLFNDVDILRVHVFEIECEFNAIIFDFLDLSLKDFFNFWYRKFSLKIMLMFVDQLICCFDYIYFNDLIHRNIKSKNCLMGVKKHKNQIYVIDLSLAMKRRAI